MQGVAFGSAIIAVITAVVEWFAKYFSRQVACVITYVASMAAIVAVFYASVAALFAMLSSEAIMGSPFVVRMFAAMAYFVPWNAKLCVGVLIAYKVAERLFDFQRKTVDLAAVKCGPQSKLEDYIT